MMKSGSVEAKNCHSRPILSRHRLSIVLLSQRNNKLQGARALCVIIVGLYMVNCIIVPPWFLHYALSRRSCFLRLTENKKKSRGKMKALDICPMQCPCSVMFLLYSGWNSISVFWKLVRFGTVICHWLWFNAIDCPNQW